MQSSKRRVRIAVLAVVAIIVVVGSIGIERVARLRVELKVNPEAWRHLDDQRLVSTIMRDAYDHRQEAFSTWYGVEMLQYPTDLMTYQELIAEVRPDFIVETGTLSGGLTLFLATVLDGMGLDSRVVTIDIEPKPWRETVAYGQFNRRLLQRIDFLCGDSVSPEIVGAVSERVQGGNVMVILDSLHSKEHVHRELELYSQLITPGGYLIVNDTSLGGAFLDASWDLRDIGPLYGVQRFLAENDAFEQAHDKQRFAVSCMHSGILRRK